MKFRLILATVACATFAPALFAQSVIKGDSAKGQEIVGKVCAACHGPDGNSPLSVNQSLNFTRRYYQLVGRSGPTPGSDWHEFR